MTKVRLQTLGMNITVFVLREHISFTSRDWKSKADELWSNTALIYVNNAGFTITVIEVKLLQIVFNTPICTFPHHFDHPEALFMFNLHVGYNNQGCRKLLGRYDHHITGWAVHNHCRHSIVLHKIHGLASLI
jgi:hypothetical protein